MAHSIEVSWIAGHHAAVGVERSHATVGLEVRYDLGLEKLDVDGGRHSRIRALFVLAVLTF